MILFCVQSNIEKGKLGKIEEYEKKVNTLEEKFDEAIENGEKKFEIVDSQVTLTFFHNSHFSQLANISEYLNRDKVSKDEMLRQRREDLAAREQEINDRFQIAER